MAVTENTYTGDGSTVLFSFTFPYLDQSHVKVSLNGSDTTAFTFANATTVQLNSAPAVGVAVRVYRNSDEDNVEATFFPGSAIRATDLNENFLQSLYLNQETRRIAQDATAGTIADGSISSAKLGSEVVTEPKIGPSAVTESKIGTGAVTEAKLGSGAVTNTKIAAGAVQTTQLATDAVTNPKIATGAVNTDELASSAVTTDKIANSAVTQDKIGTNVLTPRVSEINGGPLAGFRNAIINGNFDIWQRGTADFGQGYRADRWNAFLAAGVSMLQSRYTLTDAERNVVGFESVFGWQVFTGDTTSSVIIQQAIEGVRTFAGRQVCLSFWAFTDAGTCAISGLFAQYFGTGGSPSASVNTLLTLSGTTITTTPTKITAVVTLPSITGKTLGTNGDDYLGLQIRKLAGAANRLRITGVQVEPGPVATPFERRPQQTELALCQRYYELSRYFIPTAGTIPMGTWSVDKRATPSITIVSYESGSGGSVAASGNKGFYAGSYTATNNTRAVISGEAEL